MKKAVFFVLAFLAVLAILVVQAQDPADKSKRPSPPGQAVCTFSDGNKVTVDYGRPSMRGRKIFGGLVPFNPVWRTGANEATSFVTTTNIHLNGTLIPKGSYTLYSLPGEKHWKLIINKQTGQWGTEYNPTQDLSRVDATVQALDKPVEQFTIALPAQSDGRACTLQMDWEFSRVTAKVEEPAARN